MRWDPIKLPRRGEANWLELHDDQRHFGPERSRRQAELFERVPKDSDSDGYGIARTYGTFRTGAWLLRFWRGR